MQPHAAAVNSHEHVIREQSLPSLHGAGSGSQTGPFTTNTSSLQAQCHFVVLSRRPQAMGYWDRFAGLSATVATVPAEVIWRTVALAGSATYTTPAAVTAKALG